MDETATPITDEGIACSPASSEFFEDGRYRLHIEEHLGGAARYAGARRRRHERGRSWAP